MQQRAVVAGQEWSRRRIQTSLHPITVTPVTRASNPLPLTLKAAAARSAAHTLRSMPREDDPDRLSADDAHILGVESAVITGHTLKLVVLEPGAGPLDVEALRTAVAKRLPSQQRATQRVDTSGTAPRWVEVTDFDICDHVRRRVISDCVSQADLWKAVSELMSEHLDRARPLWTFDVIGPLADGREAIAARLHHAMVDGIAGVRFLYSVLWDPHPEPPARERPGLRGPTEAGPITEALRMPGAVLRELGHLGSRSPFDRPITGSRELAFAIAPLADLKAIGASRPAHATVNDVLLAIVAGGLRQWLGDTGSEHLRAQVPVSLHHRDEATSDLGNRDSFMNIDLPLAEADPLARLDLISASTSERKQLGDAGRRVLHLFSSSEPALHHALRISAISCAGVVGIALCVDPKALPDVARLADVVEGAYAELRCAAVGG